MRIAGIIAEYNPFHNGHAWHIRETRRLTGCDYVIVCMDGHFSQRGEPSVHSKWDRARCALQCGADAIFELPEMYAVRSADAFARGGVAILGGLGADVLSFGSEEADLKRIEKLASILQKEPTSVSNDVKAGLSAGMSYARARGEAISRHLNIPADRLNSPNLILATEYIRALRDLSPGMTATVVPRQGGYHDEALFEYASATAIRAAFDRGEYERAFQCVPEQARLMPDRLHAMDDLLLHRLWEMDISEMAVLPDVSEGLENRLYRAGRIAATRLGLLDTLKCKRYTYARLSRMLTHAVLGMSKEEIESRPLPTYARLLGVRRDAISLLAELKRRTKLPIVSNAKALRDDPVFRLECRATDLWALLHDDPALRRPGREFTEKFVRV